MKEDSVTVIIPYYQSSASLRELVKSLNQNFPVIVINNASKLPELPNHPNVRVVSNDRNDGFSHAANQGAALAKTDFLLFLNPDVFLGTDQVRALVEFADEHNLAAASPTLVDEDGNIQREYHQPLPTFMTALRSFSPLKFLSLPLLTQTVLPGAALLLKQSAWEKLNGWDERFWLWWEDSDLSWRLWRGGYQFGVASHITVPHCGGESFRPLPESWKRQVFFHSLDIFCRKHFSRWQVMAMRAITRRFASRELYPPDKAVRASVVVPNLKRDLLLRFLNQNKKTLTLQDELIVVTSTNGITELRQKFPDVIFVPIEKNHGFAPTVNIGLRRARGQYLFTVNDDTQLPSGWIDAMITAVDDKTGSVSPKIVSLTGNIESLGIDMLSNGKARPKTTAPLYHADTFNGAAVLLTRAALERVGLFDESFGSYLEDIDLGLRMKAAGFRNQVVPDVTVVHQRQATSRDRPLYKTWLDAKNWWLIVLKPYFWTHWASPWKILLERGRNVSGLLKALRQSIRQ